MEKARQFGAAMHKAARASVLIFFRPETTTDKYLQHRARFLRQPLPSFMLEEKLAILQ
jgi:hypothetical protein